MLASCPLSRGSQVFDVHDKHQVHVSHGRERWGAPIMVSMSFLADPFALCKLTQPGLRFQGDWRVTKQGVQQ